jgi:hypothetical protein
MDILKEVLEDIAKATEKQDKKPHTLIALQTKGILKKITLKYRNIYTNTTK